MNFFKKQLTLSIILLGGWIAQSCVNDDDYAVPCVEGCEEPMNWTVNTSIETLVKRANESKDPIYIRENLVFEGYVNSSDEWGNLYGFIALQDLPQNANQGIRIEINKSYLYNLFPLGSKIRVNLNGLYLGNDRGTVKIGDVYTDASGNERVGRMAEIKIKKNIEKVGSELITLLPQSFNTIFEASKPEHLGKLIILQNVQFAESELGKIYAGKDEGNVINRMVEDVQGRKIAMINNRGSDFATQSIPSKRGSITAVLGRYNSDYQLVIRSISDVNMILDRFEDTTTPVKPEEGKEGNEAFLGSDFSDWNAFTQGLDSSIKNYATQAMGEGMEERNALQIKIESPGTKGNDFVFNAKPNTTMPKTYKRIYFYMKGVSESKSFSINLYNKEGKAYYFNLKNILGDTKIISSASNSYPGKIDTKEEWVLIELSLDGITDLNDDPTKNLFALKLGSNSAFDVLIDRIMID